MSLWSVGHIYICIYRWGIYPIYRAKRLQPLLHSPFTTVGSWLQQHKDSNTACKVWIVIQWINRSKHILSVAYCVLIVGVDVWVNDLLGAIWSQPQLKHGIIIIGRPARGYLESTTLPWRTARGQSASQWVSQWVSESVSCSVSQSVGQSVSQLVSGQ